MTPANLARQKKDAAEDKRFNDNLAWAATHTRSAFLSEMLVRKASPQVTDESGAVKIDWSRAAKQVAYNRARSLTNYYQSQVDEQVKNTRSNDATLALLQTALRARAAA